MLHTLSSQIDLLLNDQLVTPSTNTYAYRAYTETLLSFGTDARNSHLQMALWYKDRAGHMETAHGNNHGLQKRTCATESHPMELVGLLHLDLLHQDKLLTNGVTMKLRLVRNRDAFCLHSLAAGAAFKINLQDVALFVRKSK